MIATYALCGFSNLASMGLMLGALGGMAPKRRSDISGLVFRAMIAGNVACFMTACIAGNCLFCSFTNVVAVMFLMIAMSREGPFSTFTNTVVVAVIFSMIVMSREGTLSTFTKTIKLFSW